ncbi:chemotaxis protein CheA [Sphaerotilus sp.]|uniref:chemotaxis protein CheA n=1 Tax=Sphaerotilus sp. TaxID=2093942 RepID=UPI002ACE3465|nr:chemotaxis protein CheA [Sphaerotilus sp.]MDZ7856076.1 chemotaxis protein CheA [Sphaerotilus sp.]
MSIDDEILATARAGFMDEALDTLRQLEQGLLRMEQDPGDGEAVHEAFRAAHTLKGAAGMFGLDALVRETHTLEGILDALRDGSQALTDATMVTLLQGGDTLAALVAALHTAQEMPDAPPARHDTGAVARAASASVATSTGHWQISLQMGPDALRNGLDPLSFIRYLDTLGTVRAVHTQHTRLPTLQALDPEGCWLDFDITLESPATRAAIEDVFDFLRDDCTLTVQATPHAAEATVPPAPPPPAEVSAVATATASPSASGPRSTDEVRFIRVRADKLDRLVDLIGELVIAGSGATSAARESRAPACIEASQRVHALVQSARDGALALRMVPIGQTFSRFQRVVRDISRGLGKEVTLEILGGDTELDRIMVDAIADPLMHLVRNSLDHGLETPAERTAHHKPAGGLLRLQARQEAGSVVIEVSDDGRGLDRGRILAKAVSRGLVAPGTILDDAQVHELLFAPGFSTAEQVTDLSGRGVGMDVVRRQVESLRGQILLRSQPGEGTLVQIRLPLTLAIIDGFLTRVADVGYVLPLDIVTECIETPAGLGARRPSGMPAASGCLDLRGQVLPYLDLRVCFGLGGERPGRQSLIVVRSGMGRIGLLVDRLLGEHQTVIKPLGPLFRHLPCIAGSTILGNGEVALILDVPALARLHTDSPRSPRLASEAP